MKLTEGVTQRGGEGEKVEVCLKGGVEFGENLEQTKTNMMLYVPRSVKRGNPKQRIRGKKKSGAGSTGGGKKTCRYAGNALFNGKETGQR